MKIEGCDHNKRSSPSTPRGNHLPSTLFDCCIANPRVQGRCGSWRSGLPPHSAKVTHKLETKIGLSAIIRPRPPAPPAPTAPQTRRLAGCGRRQASAAGERPNDQGIGARAHGPAEHGLVEMGAGGGVSGRERRGRATTTEEGTNTDMGRGWNEGGGGEGAGRGAGRPWPRKMKAILPL